MIQLIKGDSLERKFGLYDEILMKIYVTIHECQVLQCFYGLITKILNSRPCSVYWITVIIDFSSAVFNVFVSQCYVILNVKILVLYIMNGIMMIEWNNNFGTRKIEWKRMCYSKVKIIILFFG